MYSYKPEKTNKIAEGAAIFLLAVSAILIIFPSIIEISYVGVVQTIGMAAAVTALALLTRYTFKSFYYTVREGDGEDSLDLVVTECQGKREYAVCRIALSSIEEIVIADENNKDELKKRCAGRKVFSYFVEISPKNQCCIFATECGEKLVIKITPDEGLLGILKKFGKTADE